MQKKDLFLWRHRQKQMSISLLSGCGSKNAEKENAETNELNSGMNFIDYNAISDQLTIIMVAFKEGWIHRDHWIF